MVCLWKSLLISDTLPLGYGWHMYCKITCVSTLSSVFGPVPCWFVHMISSSVWASFSQPLMKNSFGLRKEAVFNFLLKIILSLRWFCVQFRGSSQIGWRQNKKRQTKFMCVFPRSAVIYAELLCIWGIRGDLPDLIWLCWFSGSKRCIRESTLGFGHSRDVSPREKVQRGLQLW